jgi:hypothetical protein
MSAIIIDDYSPEDSAMTLGQKRPWGGVNSQQYGDGTGESVLGIDLVSVVSALKNPIRYDHVQTSPSTTWVINHGLNNTRPVILVLDGSNNEVLCQKDYANATRPSPR